MTMEVINPATEEVIATLAIDTQASIATKLTMLRVGQERWVQLSVTDRLEKIQRFGELVKERREELAKILSMETGKPIKQAGGEVIGSLNRVAHLSANAEKWLASEQVITEGQTLESIHYEPLGVIANISAWNFPYNVGFNVFLYALVAGNAVLYKPSEFASLTGLEFQKLLHEAGVPEDVFQVVIGGGEVGQYLLDAPMDGYFFTGSYPTGLHIARSVAHKLVPVQLELGGKDPLYVMDDVQDVKQAAINAAEGAFYNNGQSCCAVERIYVQEDIYKAFLDHFVEEVKGYVVGDPAEVSTFIGPLTRKQQLAVLSSQVEDAVAKGAKVAVGGVQKSGQGYYFEPTVVSGVDHSMEIMMEESFGPVIGIQKVKDDEEAVRLMNDTDYGLTAAVFSADERRARDVLGKMNTGTVYWNCCDRVSPNVPWAGRGKSGLGATLSYIGIRAFTQTKSYHVRK